MNAADIKRETWDLSQLLDGDNDPGLEEKKKEIEEKSYRFINKWKDREDYLQSPDVLREALDDYEEWRRYPGSEGDSGYYFMLRTQQDQNDPGLKAKYNKIDELSRRIENDAQFFTHRIAKIPAEKQREFLEHDGLKEYRHFLSRIFAEAGYLLSEEEEKIINLKSPTSYGNWVRMTSGFLAREERKVPGEDGETGMRNFSEILSLMNSRNKKVRDAAARAFNDILKKHADAAEAEINSVLANKKVDDELRKVSRPDLMRHLHDDIESEVVDSLLEAVSGRFEISARYYGLKAGLFKVKKLKYHERNIEYGNVDIKYPFPEAADLVRSVFSGLDGKFAEIFSAFLDKGQIDIFPRKGKASGAFCAHLLITQPTYVLLNHTDKLHDVLTIAHELGHGINNELIRERQNALNFGTPTSTAEVASTFMEDFVLQEILGKADDELRLSIMMMKLNDDVSSIFRQVACYLFERDLHREFREKGYLSKEEIGQLFRKNMSAYMGDSVEQSPGSENWWVYWGHIRSFFYVYSYASGLLISKSLQNAVKRDHGFIEKVKEFLSAGLSDSPENIFRGLGVDIRDAAFWHRGLDEVNTLLQETEDLARSMKKIR